MILMGYFDACHKKTSTSASISLEAWLVGGFSNPFEKKYGSNWIIFPKFWGEHAKNGLKPPPRWPAFLFLEILLVRCLLGVSLFEFSVHRGGVCMSK